MTLAEFLLARYAEDEAAARAASPSPWQYGSVESIAGGALYDATRRIASIAYEQPDDHDGTIARHLLWQEADANGAHIARHDPARVLADVAAKRAIVARCEHAVKSFDRYPNAGNGMAVHALTDVLRALAQVYSSHPDFRAEWSA